MNNNETLVKNILERGNLPELRQQLQYLLPDELADLLPQLRQDERTVVFNNLTPVQGVHTFELLPFSIQKQCLETLPYDRAAYLLNEISPDDRTAFLEELPSQTLKELLKLLNPSERSLTLKLLGYPEGSVGRLMTTDYIAVKSDWSAQEVLEHVRRYGHYSETIDVLYVTDDTGFLVDDIDIKEFLFADPQKKVSNLSDKKIVSLLGTDDQQMAINVFRRYNRAALPVTDARGILLGIVTIDDMLKLIKDEDTEDFQMVGGNVALDEPYMNTSFFHLIKKRIGWLTVLFIGETLTTTAMAFYQDEIAKAVVLVLFLPLIISSGGNSGSQASTLIIRAMALGEVGIGDWWRVMKREVFAGLFLGLVLGLVGFFRISLWSTFSTIYGEHWILIAITVWLSLICVVLWGTLSGSMLPLLLKKLKFDPAVSSAPFVATLVDVTGIIIYFSIALIILQGTLL